MKITEEEVLMAALESGIMISTQYGQKPNQPMPVSDRETLMAFALNLLGRAEMREEK